MRTGKWSYFLFCPHIHSFSIVSIDVFKHQVDKMPETIKVETMLFHRILDFCQNIFSSPITGILMSQRIAETKTHAYFVVFPRLPYYFHIGGFIDIRD